MADLKTILDTLEDRELDYVVSRSTATSDAAAYKDAGVPKSTFYGWTAERRELLNDYAQQLKRQAKIRALLVLQDHAESAAKALVALLKSEDDRVRLNAAGDVLDRTIGRPQQSIQHSTPDGDGAGGVMIYIPDNGRGDHGDGVTGGDDGNGDPAAE